MAESPLRIKQGFMNRVTGKDKSIIRGWINRQKKLEKENSGTYTAGLSDAFWVCVRRTAGGCGKGSGWE